MTRADALAWGAAGALSFLVLAFGYRLVLGRLAGLLTLLAVAAGVGVTAGVAAYLLEPRLQRND